MSRLIFDGGPRHGTWEEHPGVAPSRAIPVYAQPDSELVCADEQVIKLLGKYWRAIGSESPNYLYIWESAEEL